MSFGLLWRDVSLAIIQHLILYRLQHMIQQTHYSDSEPFTLSFILCLNGICFVKKQEISNYFVWSSPGLTFNTWILKWEQDHETTMQFWDGEKNRDHETTSFEMERKIETMTPQMQFWDGGKNRLRMFRWTIFYLMNIYKMQYMPKQM